MVSQRSLRLDATAVGRINDSLAAAIAASLPWSTSATGVLVAFWLVCTVSSGLDIASIRRVLPLPACTTVFLLVGVACLGMLWAGVAWPARIAGLTSFLKLLCIPILIVQFSKSDRASQVLTAFFASSLVLLAASWSLYLMGLPIGMKPPGIPVKDYVAQSAVFSTCTLIVFGFAEKYWRQHSRAYAIGAIALALPFILNIFFVAPSRTYLLILPALLLLAAFRAAGSKGLTAAILIRYRDRRRRLDR